MNQGVSAGQNQSGYKPIDWVSLRKYYSGQRKKESQTELERVGGFLDGFKPSRFMRYCELKREQKECKAKDKVKARVVGRSAVRHLADAIYDIIRYEKLNCEKYGIPFDENKIDFKDIFGDDYSKYQENQKRDHDIPSCEIIFSDDFCKFFRQHESEKYPAVLSLPKNFLDSSNIDMAHRLKNLRDTIIVVDEIQKHIENKDAENTRALVYELKLSINKKYETSGAEVNKLELVIELLKDKGKRNIDWSKIEGYVTEVSNSIAEKIKDYENNLVVPYREYQRMKNIQMSQVDIVTNQNQEMPQNENTVDLFIPVAPKEPKSFFKGTWEYCWDKCKALTILLSPLILLVASVGALVEGISNCCKSNSQNLRNAPYMPPVER